MIYVSVACVGGNVRTREYASAISFECFNTGQHNCDAVGYDYIAQCDPRVINRLPIL